MVVNNLKELKALIKMLKKEGVDAIKIDNLEFCIKIPVTTASYKQASKAIYRAPGDIQEDTKIVTDELTEDQLLMWSAHGQDQQ